MNITAKYSVGVVRTCSGIFTSTNFAVLTLVLFSACATQPKRSPSSTGATHNTSSGSDENDEFYIEIPSASGTPTQATLLPELGTPKNPKEFAVNLVELMGTTPGKCGAAAENSPQVNWTCAEYTNGLSTFIAQWDRLIRSAEVTLKHSYIATSDWMYFEVDGEIDFFWKTYDLDTTQALVAYDPSEIGNELIIGLNPTIGTQMAAANGSHNFSSQWPTLPVQE